MNYAIILSGGIGTRMQMGDFPKQYLEVEKKPILLYTLEQFQKSSAVEKIVIVAADAWREKIRGWMEEDGITKFLAFADAGDTRQESIHNGLTVCMEDSVSENDGVIIHDGVRPLVSEQLIGDCLAALADHEGCMPVLPMKDTIYQSSDGTKIDHLLQRQAADSSQGTYLSAYRTIVFPGKILFFFRHYIYPLSDTLIIINSITQEEGFRQWFPRIQFWKSCTSAYPQRPDRFPSIQHQNQRHRATLRRCTRCRYRIRNKKAH